MFLSRLTRPLEELKVTQGFSWRHKAIDWRASVGTPVYASHAGDVVQITTSGNCGMGLAVQKGHRRFRDCHMRDLAVELGSAVRKGQLVGYSGATGTVTGPHLHEVHGIFCKPWPGDCLIINPRIDLLASQAVGWGLLVGGVGLMGWLAWKLGKLGQR